MRILCAIVALAFGLACRTESNGAPQPVAAASAGARAGTPAPSPHDTLDLLDQRRPVPLLPMMAQHQKENMREHLEAVQEVVAAAAVNDFDKAAGAAKRLGFSETMGRMCEHMGAAAPGFTEQALAFHHTADDIVTAATRRDGPAVLSALSKTLSACTGCHATFKQRPVATLPD